MQNMLSPKQQAFDLVNKSQNVLIVLPLNYTADALGSGLALTMLIKELGKKADLIIQQPSGEKLSFLPGLEMAKSEVAPLRDFIISIDTSQKKIKQLRYENKNSVLKIFLAGPDSLEQKDIRLEPGPFNYDLLVTVDASDLETIGQLYEKHADLFFEKPILNIDHKSGNEYFGEVNLVEPTSSSCAEIITDFLNSFFPNQISPPLATCLLTGIIEETRSFQKTNTTPQTFNLASLLITQGAEKEKIVQFLYKTKPLPYLKLWGRLLGGLEFDREKGLAWMVIGPAEFEEGQPSLEDLISISDEINDLLPQLNASFLLWADQFGSNQVLIQSSKPELLQRLNLQMGGSLKNHQLFLKIIEQDLNLAKAELDSLINPLL
jgi:nanoRNase/pAp phosphatase (c-di-AMP/oligoRNAs hydrolase)